MKCFDSSFKGKEKDTTQNQCKPKVRDSKRDKTKMQRLQTVEPLPLEEHFENQVSLSSNHNMSSDFRKSH